MIITEQMIECAAKAISRMVPLDGSSHWNEGHGHDFPLNYSEREKLLIREIARVCLDAAAQSFPQEAETP